MKTTIILASKLKLCLNEISRDGTTLKLINRKKGSQPSVDTFGENTHNNSLVIMIKLYECNGMENASRELYLIHIIFASSVFLCISSPKLFTRLINTVRYIDEGVIG